MIGHIKKGRKSVFREVGLEEPFYEGESGEKQPEEFGQPVEKELGEQPHDKEFEEQPHEKVLTEQPHQNVVSEKDIGEVTSLERSSNDDEHDNNTPTRGASMRAPKTSWYSKLSPRRPRVRTATSTPAPGLHRITMLALIVALVFPGISFRKRDGQVDVGSADAGLIRLRDESPIDVCTRWAHQGTFPQTDKDKKADLRSGPGQRHSVYLRRPGQDGGRPGNQHVEYVPLQLLEAPR